MAVAMNEAEDHRVRVAAERRARMRLRLLQAVLDTCALQTAGGLPALDDVSARAAVSKATFYKYFTSVEEAVDEVGRNQVDEMIHTLVAMFDGPETPFFRMTVAIQLFLLRGVLAPTWAAFASRPDTLAYDNILLRGITTHLEASREVGILHFADTEAAATIAIGTLREAMGHLARRNGDIRREYVEEVEVMILRAIGMELDAARKAVRDAVVFIRGTGPDRLAWWRDPWTTGSDEAGHRHALLRPA
jgi:AcrR family transcriptional regulator